jgi:hypothetical protein
MFGAMLLQHAGLLLIYTHPQQKTITFIVTNMIIPNAA